MSTNGSFQTDDLALATLLVVNGFEYHMERGRRDDNYPICFWIFDSNDKARKLIEQYISRRARVEPNKFVRTWGVIRKDMLEFLHS